MPSRNLRGSFETNAPPAFSPLRMIQRRSHAVAHFHSGNLQHAIICVHYRCLIASLQFQIACCGTSNALLFKLRHCPDPAVLPGRSTFPGFEMFYNPDRSGLTVHLPIRELDAPLMRVKRHRWRASTAAAVRCFPAENRRWMSLSRPLRRAPDIPVRGSKSNARGSDPPAIPRSTPSMHSPGFRPGCSRSPRCRLARETAPV